MKKIELITAILALITAAFTLIENFNVKKLVKQQATEIAETSDSLASLRVQFNSYNKGVFNSTNSGNGQQAGGDITNN